MRPTRHPGTSFWLTFGSFDTLYVHHMRRRLWAAAQSCKETARRLLLAQKKFQASAGQAGYWSPAPPGPEWLKR